MEDAFAAFFVMMLIIVILVTLFIIGWGATEIIKSCLNESTITEEIIEVEVVRLEIVQGDSSVKYYVTLQNEEYANVLKISKDRYASMKVGDKAQLRITKVDNTHLKDETEFEIIK